MEISKIAVMGTGTMGRGIVQVAAAAGYTVFAVDVAQDILAKSQQRIEAGIAKWVEKGKITEDAGKAMASAITYTTDLHQISDVDLVVEAIVEQVEIKVELFSTLDTICKPETILASNTSSISITQLAAATHRPGQVIGMHFMNPVPLMKLVEIIRGLETSDDTYRIVQSASEKMGKTPVEVNDSAGFVSNRVLMPMINEAIFCLYEGVGTAEAIDTVMKLGMNHPMGPLALADLIGLDVCLDILHVLYEEFKDPKYRPCPLLVKMVRAGKLGKKTGQGFYSYGG
ncbi:MAG TPA: 3-hydroxybutyryl-CoA dehydrogenase [Thermoanaerobaculia bacterium]|nr:3-hydroxybutyryl-CoA dehydrogenase [Thermoanaerobaculia bacterium]HUM30899.1 3-hydroxybutyryl-CoA dehydrogenase [Thermoanaerobaculia bacterium]HXK69209.1 3-hydroxybutyryl-CoA dehydrogenase [Thermoanaerobaculia bacterium]